MLGIGIAAFALPGLLLLGCEARAPGRSSSPEPLTSTEPLAPGSTALCRVASITDGDTFRCEGGRRVRLLLIDTPEIAQAPFGNEAREALAALLPLGSDVTLQIDVDPEDQFERTLAYVVLPDGRIANEELLRQGFAVVYVFPPNVAQVERFRAAAEGAREARRGLWAVDAFTCLPSDFRSGDCGPR
jgi:micrococcal nuclease